MLAIALVAAGVVGAEACAVAHAQQLPDAGRAADAASSASADAGAGADAAVAARSDAGAGAGGDAAAATYTGPPPHIALRTPGGVRVTQGLTPGSVERIWRRNLAAVTQCYTTALAANPRLHGQLTMHLEVIAGGLAQVDRVHFAPRAGNEALEQCIQRVYQGITDWPNPRGVPSTDVNIAAELAPTPPVPPGRRPR